jgi:CheY-like chemotaxis protein
MQRMRGKQRQSAQHGSGVNETRRANGSTVKEAVDDHAHVHVHVHDSDSKRERRAGDGAGGTNIADSERMPKFLVVDDDRSTVSAMARLLSDDGHQVAPFTAGAEAVDAISRESFDAVVTDLEMPVVDGHAVVRAARQRLPESCLVVVTARADETQKSLVDAGVCIVMDKPVDYDGVTKAVADCRARGGPGAHGKCHLRSRALTSEPIPLRHK